MNSHKSQLIQFGSKADTLKSLEARLSQGIVLPQVSFQIVEWKNHSESVLSNIQKVFSPRSVIVRSSASSEDTKTESLAGHFLSIPHVSTKDSIALKEAIERVADSYGDNICDNDQIFVQEMLDDVLISGVAFTCDISTLAPYYVVNYDDTSGSTQSVTSGASNSTKTYIRFKESPEHPPKELEVLFETLHELEGLFNCKRLDVEFAIGKTGTLYVLQVRPIATKNESFFPTSELKEALRKIQLKVRKINGRYPYLYGSSTTLGVMPDWNPAEIIGTKPRAMALSLYKELVTDSIWAYQRDNYGYKNLRGFPLIRSLMGNPYIDVRITFNSFLPKGLNDALSEKLVDFYLERLRTEPHNHDKIEFQIVYSCAYLNLDEKLAKLLKFGFDSDEIAQLKNGLVSITKHILDPDHGLILEDLQKIETLKSRQATIMGSELPAIDKIYWLIEDCKRFGTLPFAGLARAGFVATQFLNSMVETGIFTLEDKEKFMSAIKTVTLQLTKDIALLKSGKISREKFLSDYGHLRPGTYDILSPRYDEAFDRYFLTSEHGEEETVESPFQPRTEQLLEIEKKLSTLKLDVSAIQLLDFMKKAIKAREEAKFVFTRSLSDALYLMHTFASRFGISREDLSHVSVQKILSLYSDLTNENLESYLADEIARQKRNYELTKALRLPQLLVSDTQIYDFFLDRVEPNYISTKKIIAEVIPEKQFKNLDDSCRLRGRIVMIPSADPGYDWIFSHGIKGLITMYGGANSHMAIRAAELQIPAVIGAGEQNFNNWAKARILLMDPVNQTVTIVDRR